ncbi:MAG: tRNA lysidine(34) synthetase TilS [Magnetococcus sp. DMHC-1]
MSCDPLLTRFRAVITPLLPDGGGLVVAVSGGPDSMALLHLLVRSGLPGRHACVVAHFDHALRPTSGDDARFVGDAATCLQLPFCVERWQEPLAVGNLPERARLARYHFLEQTAHRTGAKAILTGHQQDDQAETFLERLLRGSGVRGLGCMAAVRPLRSNPETGPESLPATPLTLVRPLLTFRRAALRQWLQANSLTWREDPGNLDLRRQRSRLRLKAIPCLTALNPDDDPIPRLATTAERLQDAEVALEWTWQRLRQDLDWQTPEKTTLTLSHARLIELPAEFIRRTLVHGHATVTGDPFPPGARAMAGFMHHLHLKQKNWSMRVRGMTIQRVRERLIFRKNI